MMANRARSEERPPRMPAEAFPPGEFVRDEMEARGWTPEQFVEMVGWEQSMLRALLSGTEPITAAQAADLERGFGISRSFWLSVEVSYRRWLGRVHFDGCPGYAIQDKVERTTRRTAATPAEQEAEAL